jgi:hypothetical protein
LKEKQQAKYIALKRKAVNSVSKLQYSKELLDLNIGYEIFSIMG